MLLGTVISFACLPEYCRADRAATRTRATNNCCRLSRLLRHRLSIRGVRSVANKNLFAIHGEGSIYSHGPRSMHHRSYDFNDRKRLPTFSPTYPSVLTFGCLAHSTLFVAKLLLVMCVQRATCRVGTTDQCNACANIGVMNPYRLYPCTL